MRSSLNVLGTCGVLGYKAEGTMYVSGLGCGTGAFAIISDGMWQ